MINALLISVRFHDNRYHGTGDWPPAPARLFQALVAAAGKFVEKKTCCACSDAMVWLENLAAPDMAAPAEYMGKSITLFVPNNDLDAKDGNIRRIAKIRTAKYVRPRLFDSTIPLLYVWHFDGNDDHAKQICKIAEGLYQLGRGVDMAWAIGEVLSAADAEIRLAEHPGRIYRPSSGSNGTAFACPREGTLASLDDRHKKAGERFSMGENGELIYKSLPRPQFHQVAYDSPATYVLFDLRYTTVPSVPFAPWPLAKAAALVEQVRGTDGNDGQSESGAFKRLVEYFPRGEIGRILIGRDATEEDKTRRLRIIPLPSIGHAQADREIRRVLLELPPNCPKRAEDIDWAFSGLKIKSDEIDVETGEIVSPELVRADDDSMLKHYGIGNGSERSRLWRSVTPLALPEASMHAVIQALRHVEVRQRIVNLRVQREPFEAKGERAEAFAAGTRFPEARLWHVEIEFIEPVGGPLVLGDGRYLGLGLMAPVRKVEGVFCFAIVDGLEEQADRRELARALRCAVMARVQEKLGDKVPLPLFFTGHESSGEIARGGGHSHLVYVPDLARRRLLIIAPHVIEHREPIKNGSADERNDLATLEQSLVGFDVLRAGGSGKLRLAAQVVNLADDPLFTASKTWIAQTPYTATRHAKRNGADSLQADLKREVQRRGLPAPLAVCPMAAEGRQEDATVPRVRLEFKVAVRGPLLLGKDLHFGGGLFSAEFTHSPISTDSSWL